MLQICRFFDPNAGPRFGAVVAGEVYDLTASGQPALATLNAWLGLVVSQGLAQATARLTALTTQLAPSYRWSDLQRPLAATHPHLLPPLDEQEVWAAGVTYLRSREAREEESHQLGIYDKVYEAEWPEIFLKATPHRVVGSHDSIRIRADAAWNVPEPELTVLLAPDLQLVGYTAGNDVSSRDIEGANPLYLPQAKIYSRSCALGPAITLAGEVESAVFPINLSIARQGQVIFRGETSTAQMKRNLAELIDYLGRDNDFPHGVFLMTGTGLVPPDEYTLLAGDVVEIDIEGIGQLRNSVIKG